MALLGEIRRRSWLLIIMIALGMGGFLLMDMSGPGGGGFGGGQNVGSINGKKISIQEYQQRLNARQNTNINSFEQNKNVWDEFVLESVLDEEADALGYGVSGNELNELMVGQNVSPMVYRAFANPQNGQLDRQSLTTTYDNFKNRALSVEGQHYMRNLEEQVLLQQKGAKLSSLVSAALYTPKWLAEQEKGGQLQSAEVTYAVVPFAEVDDSQVQISDNDLSGYLNNNIHTFKTDEETRTVEYVTFPVEATDEDKSKIRSDLKELAVKFRNTSENEQFVQENYGAYDSRYVMKEELNQTVANELFELDNGNVVGPYLDGDYYRITKLIDRRAVPDSVKSRHILRSASPNNPLAMAAARKTIDSLKTILETERNKKRRKRSAEMSFDSLALNFGQDGTASQGGDLGYQGPVGFVKEFRDLIFYEAKEGELSVVETQFGVHLVEVTGVKKSGKIGARVATVSQYISPSKNTQNRINNEAFAFVRDNRSIEAMRKSAQEKGLRIRKADGLTINGYTVGELEAGESSRNIVKFAFEADPGEVSPDIFTYDEDAVEFYTNAYVVAALNSVHKAGTPSLDAVRSIVTQQVMKQKKGESITSKIGNNPNVEAITNNYPGATSTERTLNFPTGIPNEPKVNAAIQKLNNGQTATIIGEAGVYVVRMNAKTEAGSSIEDTQNALNNQTRQQMLQSTALIDALQKNADISDQRFKFY